MSQVTDDVLHQELDAILANSQAYFERTISVLTEEHASLKPNDGAFTPPAMIAHVAITVDWFMDGALKGDDGFSMDFEAHDREAKLITSMEAARSMLKDAYESARARTKKASAEQWMSPLPLGPIMGGLPRRTVISGIQEHTAHHRGALSVYARLAGLTAPMPYGDF